MITLAVDIRLIYTTPLKPIRAELGPSLGQLTLPSTVPYHRLHITLAWFLAS